MSPENKAKLEKYRDNWNIYKNDQTISLSLQARQDILDVIKAEIDPNYTVMFWCGNCLGEMMKLAFKNLDNER